MGTFESIMADISPSELGVYLSMNISFWMDIYLTKGIENIDRSIEKIYSKKQPYISVGRMNCFVLYI